LKLTNRLLILLGTLIAFSLIAAACGDHTSDWQEVSASFSYSGSTYTCTIDTNHAAQTNPASGDLEGLTQYVIVANPITPFGRACDAIVQCVQFQDAATETGQQICAQDDTPPTAAPWGGDALWTEEEIVTDGVTDSSVKIILPISGNNSVGPCDYHDANDSNSGGCPDGLPIPS
jgi:hypothetical protein